LTSSFAVAESNNFNPILQKKRKCFFYWVDIQIIPFQQELSVNSYFKFKRKEAKLFQRDSKQSKVNLKGLKK